MIFQSLGLTPQRSAHVAATGALAVIAIGTIGTVVLVLAAIWLAVQFIALILTATVEVCTTIATTYNGADSLVKFLILLACGYVVYRVVRRTGRF